jgi:hypothetical protein
MLWQNKITWSELVIAAAVWKVQDDPEWTFSDAIVIASATVSVGAVWIPELRTTIAGGAFAIASAPAAAVLAPIAAGVVVSAAIGGPKGVENFFDFYTDYKKIPGRLAFTAKTIKKEKIDPMFDKLVMGGKIVKSAVVAEADRRIAAVKNRYDRAEDWFMENRRFLFFNPTPGARLF